MISRAWNSELINKIAQDFAQATGLAVVVVNIHGDEISESFNSHAVLSVDAAASPA